MNIRRLILITIISIVGFSIQGNAQVTQKLPEKTRILFLLDGSGSMLAPWDGALRIQHAKRILSELVDSLQADKNLELALRVYGHQYHRKLHNCTDSRLEVGFSPNNHALIKSKLSQIGPKGTTPIAYSLEQAANDFPMDLDVRNIIIIITDGIEACDGDPCAVSLALQKKNIFLKPFIIGLGMDKDFKPKFECVGQYIDAQNSDDFKRVLNSALKQTLDKTTVSVELLDEYNKPKETDINVTFLNAVTQKSVYEFVHYRNQAGKPDSVEVDAVLTYDLVINTTPPVRETNIRLEGGKHNVIKVKAPQGSLQIKLPSYTSYKKGVKVIVKERGREKILTVMDISEIKKFLVGEYDLEILTLPVIKIKNIEVKQSETTVVDVPAPGLLNIMISVKGVGGIYQMGKGGKQRLIHNLNENKTRMNVTLQPGDYKLVFRAANAKGSKYTQVKTFKIKSGATVNVNPFSR